jgi:NAD(P)-dependent dehydrogenase (short-subunit alcohol dehydrogenase family)
LGKNAITLKADVTKAADLDQLFGTVREKHGRIDVLFANAGVAKLAPLESTSEELFDEMLETNFRGAYFTVQKALSLLTEDSAIIFTTSYFDQVGGGRNLGGLGQQGGSAVADPDPRPNSFPVRSVSTP